MFQSAEVLSFPELPEHRLRRAILRLEEALQEQGRAVAGFRATLAELATAVGSLDETVEDYRGALDGAAWQVGRAQASARALEARANSMARRG
jgi:ABC-type transporter Mla subunit MlaD